MSPSDIEVYFDENPVGPYRITLSSGDQLAFQSRAQAAIGEGTLALYIYDKPEQRTGRRLKVVSIPNVVLLERLDSARPPRGRSRRR